MLRLFSHPSGITISLRADERFTLLRGYCQPHHQQSLTPAVLSQAAALVSVLPRAIFIKDPVREFFFGGHR